MAKVVDMTTGSPFKKILIFSIPIALSFLLQQLYSLGDSLIVSLSRGADATTGINLTASLTFLLLGFAQGISVGFGVVLSQFVGAKNEQKMRQCFAVSIMLTLMVSIVFTVLGCCLARPMLELLETDERYIDYSTEYTVALFAGVVFTLMYNLTGQVLRAMGDSKTPLYILILCAVLNIGLNSLLFITELPVAWAGWATVISQGISALVCFAIILRRFAVLRFKADDFKCKPAFAFRLLSVGLPMAFQFSVTALGCMIQQRAFNMLGDDFAMAQGAASKIDNIFVCFINGAGTSMATYCGQNYGAGNVERIKKGFIIALGIGGIVTAISMSGAILLCRPLAYLLLPGVSAAIYDTVFNYVLVQALMYYVLFLVFMPRQAVQAIGLSSLSIVGGVIELVMRFAASSTLIVWLGEVGAYFSNPLAWLGSAIFFVIVFAVRIKKLERDGIDASKMSA